MLSVACLNLKLLEHPLGAHPSVGALDDNGGVAGPTVLPPLQPAQDMLLDDGGFVVYHELWAQQTQTVKPVGPLAYYAENYNTNYILH